ncbi:dehydrogenase reductase sdr family member 4 [Stylonychia lemnae]|uniref:Dehydrogenase reductase sdr family member 4 n=1 Tax=Stylonychia lemnae TaxID=5949 RepID=A0A078AFE5_STYLE|nr:dehydrogenase reductase sdr family member 4 [Stylonychia lemnae]|eukprot:CDW80890.1 dehydrogenase reductase sdr family member 4 [Stylonychia lemnae]
MLRFKDKVVLVTGGTTGIGYAIAERIAREGGEVFICSSQQSNVDEAIKKFKEMGLNISGTTCNISKSQDRKKVLEIIEQKHGRLDVLVLNAGISNYAGKNLLINEEAYDELFNVNVKSQFFFIKEAYPLLKKSPKDANILVNSSIMGKSPDKFIGVYAMTKATLISMIKSLAQELIPDNIRINGIGPGFVETHMTEPIKMLQKSRKQELNPKIYGQPSQIASIVATMCSEDGSFVNGETYFMQGVLGKI